MSLFSRPPDVVLSKVYVSLNPCQRLDSLVSMMFANQDAAPQSMSLNYGPDQQPDVALQILAESKPEQIEAAMALHKDGALCLALGKSLRSSHKNSVFECTSVRHGNTSFEPELGLFARLANLFEIHYGYARLLSTTYSPLSESPIKSSIFGSLSVSVELPSFTWLSKHDDVAAGAAKGIFPVNYWSSNTVVELARLIRMPNELQSPGLHALTGNLQKSILHENPEHKRHFHFGSK